MQNTLLVKRFKQAPRAAAIGLIRLYSYLVSPMIGNNCRFYPTCSRYAVEAISLYGVFKGSYLALRRLLRCHPWCEGGVDPVPDYKNSH